LCNFWNYADREAPKFLQEEPCCAPLCPPHIPHSLSWDWTQIYALRCRRLTVWAMTQPIQRQLEHCIFCRILHCSIKGLKQRPSFKTHYSLFLLLMLRDKLQTALLRSGLFVSVLAKCRSYLSQVIHCRCVYSWYVLCCVVGSSTEQVGASCRASGLYSVCIRHEYWPL
jgi:hypothetical protein